uniref:Uncharacterized protein n=1 Tax=Romanomermis culicivorax TaxID=13658 RepID=A0A915K8M9_ROMCU
MIRPIKLKLWYHSMALYRKRFMKEGHLKKDSNVAEDNLPHPLPNFNSYSNVVSGERVNEIEMEENENDRGTEHLAGISIIDNDIDQMDVTIPYVVTNENTPPEHENWPMLSSAESSYDFVPFYMKNTTFSNRYHCSFMAGSLSFNTMEHYLFYHKVAKLGLTDEMNDIQNIKMAATAK